MLAGAQRNSSLQCGWEGKRGIKKKKRQSRPSHSAIGILRVPPAGQHQRGPAWQAIKHSWFLQDGCVLVPRARTAGGNWATVSPKPAWAGEGGREGPSQAVLGWPGAQGAHGAAQPQRAAPGNLHLHHACTFQWVGD